MYEAFLLTLNQVTGPIGCDTMSMKLLCVIDVSHGIDKNIIKIALVAIYIFFHKWQKASVPTCQEKKKKKVRQQRIGFHTSDCETSGGQKGGTTPPHDKWLQNKSREVAQPSPSKEGRRKVAADSAEWAQCVPSFTWQTPIETQLCAGDEIWK